MIHRKKSKFSKAVNLLCLVILIGTILFLVVSWGNIPDRIPGHYNAAGEVDRVGGKGEIIMIPVMEIILYGLITLVEQFPQVWNTGVKPTKENEKWIYSATGNLIAAAKIVMVTELSYITIATVRMQSLGKWFLPVSLAAIAVPFVCYMVYILRKGKK